MYRNTILCVLALGMLWVWTTAAQEVGSDPDQKRLVEVEKQLALAEHKLKEQDEHVKKLEAQQTSLLERVHASEKDIDHIFIMGAAATLLISLVGVGVYRHLKQWSQDTLLAEVKEELTSNLNLRFDEARKSFQLEIEEGFEILKSRITDLEVNLERQLSDLITVLRRTGERRPDQAIEEIGWRGDAESLASYAVAVRKLVIQAALTGPRSRQRFGDAAWEAAEKIFREDRTETNLSFLYRTAAQARDWSRGYDYYERYHQEIGIRSNPDGFLALLKILRIGPRPDFKGAIRAEKLYDGPSTPAIAHYLGHLRNNMALFEEADGLLYPEVESIVRGGLGKLPESWVQVAYSFLLNCMEWNRPERALAVARLGIRARGDALLQLGILRLALQLSSSGQRSAGEELIEGVRENLKYFPEGSVTIQIKARLIYHDQGGVEGASKAVDYLRDQEEWVLSKKALDLMKEDRGQVFSDRYDLDLPRPEYFYVCLMGEMLIEAGRLEDARKVLYKLSLEDPVGEAHFLIALSYAREPQDPEATEHVERAGMVHRRWCRITELYPELMECHERLGVEPCCNVPEWTLKVEVEEAKSDSESTA